MVKDIRVRYEGKIVDLTVINSLFGAPNVFIRRNIMTGMANPFSGEHTIEGVTGWRKAKNEDTDSIVNYLKSLQTENKHE